MNPGACWPWQASSGNFYNGVPDATAVAADYRATYPGSPAQCPVFEVVAAYRRSIGAISLMARATTTLTG